MSEEKKETRGRKPLPIEIRLKNFEEAQKRYRDKNAASISRISKEQYYLKKYRENPEKYKKKLQDLIIVMEQIRNREEKSFSSLSISIPPLTKPSTHSSTTSF